MKILLLPCHSILEHDEMKLWLELGHDVFSLGSYVNPATPHDVKRPALPDGQYKEILVGLSSIYSKDALHPEQIEPFDVIIVHHVKNWIINNWELLKHKKVVWRTIGQSTASYEYDLQKPRDEGLKVIRYSPREQNIHMNIGQDAMIRFYKDPEEFKDWNGADNRVMALGQSIKKRGDFTQFEIFDSVTNGLPRAVYGANNEDIEGWGGQLSYDELKRVLRDTKVFFYTGTQPASYTLGFIEAMMTGIPIVAIGKEHGNSLFNHEQDTYEIPDIIRDGINGFVSDDPSELRERVKQLLNDANLARKISEAGRQTAIELFGKDKIKQEWQQFLNNL